MRLSTALLTVLLAALPAACGQKGPLYLPDNPPTGFRKPKPPAPKPVPYPAEPATERNSQD